MERMFETPERIFVVMEKLKGKKYAREDVNLSVDFVFKKGLFLPLKKKEACPIHNCTSAFVHPPKNSVKKVKNLK